MTINLILSDSVRSNIYLSELIKNKININEIIIYSNKKIKYLKKIMRKNAKQLNFNFLNCKSINSKLISKKILLSKNNDFLFSGYAGEIFKNLQILKQKRIFHCHPGKIPNFRGSTTIYYSLILNNEINCTLFRMTRKIDKGQIFLIKSFTKPKNIKKIENTFDHFIRANTLISFCKKKQNKPYKKIKTNGNYYYIAHPVIRNLVLNKGNIKRVLNL